MVMQGIGRYLPGVLMVVALLTPSLGFSQVVHERETVIESFLAPDAHAKPAPRHPAARREHRRGKENHGQVRSETSLQTILRLRAEICHRLTDQNL